MTHCKKSIALVSALVLSPALQTPASAATLQQESSSLGILTDKEGIASGLAHRHIIVATKWSGHLDMGAVDPASEGALAAITSGKADIRISVEDLIVDNPAAAAGIIPAFKAAKLWSDADKLEPGNSAKVRDNMLDETQLDVKTYSTIEGQGDFSQCEKQADGLSCKLNLTLSIKGKKITKNLNLQIRKSGSALTASFVSPYQFSEFGIKPYTAMLGAIAVKNDFYIAAQLTATK